MHGHDIPFTTSNYGLTTTPENEYKIVTGETDCPEEDKKDKLKRTVRVIKSIEDLKRLEIAQKAKLEEVEIFAVVRGTSYFDIFCTPSARYVL